MATISHHAPGRGGIYSPARDLSARNTAENSHLSQTALACGRDAVSVVRVVAGLPQGSGAHSPNRYPSPDRRHGAATRMPPLFYFDRMAGRYRQELAQKRSSAWHRFDLWRGLNSNYAAKDAYKIRGRAKCSEQSQDHQRQSLPFWPFRRSPHAVTRLVSRPLSAGARARLVRPCWTVMSSPVLLLAQPVTSPSVKPTPSVAAKATQNLTRASGQAGSVTPHYATIRANVHEWSFLFSGSQVAYLDDRKPALV